MKKGFTLAEVMIVLAIIGILTAIMLPAANRSKPNENVLKFKKAHETLYAAIHELVNNEKYYNGLFDIRAGGNAAGKSYFCESFADLVSAKSVVCNYESSTADFVGTCKFSGNGCTPVYTQAEIDALYDNNCRYAERDMGINNPGILTTDNIRYFETSLNNFFGCIYKSSDPNTICKKNDDGDDYLANTSMYTGPKGYRAMSPDGTGIETYRFYRIFCIDIDGWNEGEAPFGYGIRVDGKIQLGTRAKEWLDKSIQEK